MFMVMAAAAPMAVVVALMPMAFAFGNGAGVPAVYLGSAIAILFFAVGYVRIIPYVRNAGAFYAYISCKFRKDLRIGGGLYRRDIVFFVVRFHLRCAGILRRRIVRTRHRPRHSLGNLGGPRKSV